MLSKLLSFPSLEIPTLLIPVYLYLLIHCIQVKLSFEPWYYRIERKCFNSSPLK